MKQKLQRVIIVLALALSASACSKAEEKSVSVGSHSLKAKEKWTGEAIFIERCRDCHKVNEIGGVVGPDLSNVGAKRDSQYLAQVIRQPSKIYPGTAMPPYDILPPEQIKLLVDYLIGLK